MSCLPLETCPPAKKSVTCSRSFGSTVTSPAELREAVAVYTGRAAERMRRHRLAAGAVTVWINTNRFSTDAQYSNSHTFELASPTDVTDELLSWSLRALGGIYRPDFRYKKAGVLLSHLVPADRLTMRLYGDDRFEQRRRVTRAVDEINRRHGRDTVRLGAAPSAARWATKFSRRTQNFTTRLAEVASVR